MIDVLGISDYISNKFAQGAERGTKERINHFASQAYGADPEQRNALVQQVVATDANAGFALGKTLDADEDRRTQTLVNMSKMLTSIPDEYRGPLYQKMRPSLERMGLQNLPADYVPEVGGIAEKIVSAYSGTAGNGVQSTYINRAGQRVAIMRDGSQQVLGDADARTQLRDQPGIAPSIVDLRSGTARPLSDGPAPAARAPGEVPFAIDPSIPPEVQAEIRASEAAGQPLPSQVSIPQAGGGGLTATRPSVSPAEAERLRLAQEANRRAAEAAARAEQAAAESRARDARGSAPQGMRFRPDGSLEPIPGAGVTGSEDERKAAGWYAQATKALTDMDAALAAEPDAATPGLVEAYSPVDEIANRARSPSRQRYVQAASAFSEAVLRAATGAGVNADEARQKIAELTPQRGDSEAVIQQKRASAAMYVQSLQARAGRALPSNSPNRRATDRPQAGAVRRATNPRTGEVVELRNGQWVPVR